MSESIANSKDDPNHPKHRPEGMSEETQRKFDLITHNLDSWIDADLIRKCIDNDDLKIYWGTATTGCPHLGYFVPMYKIGDYLKAGCHVTILFADLHGFLDNMKSTWEVLSHRCEYYELVIKTMLKRINVPLEKLRFIKGTDFQTKADYTLDMYKMAALVTTDHTQKAGAEVVKKVASPLMSSLLYPILQALDEQYLGVDVQFGGVDQRKIFMFAREKLPLVGYKKRGYLMNPLVPGLGKSGKMSSSEPASKIDFDDADDVIKKKIMKAYSVDGEPEGNGLLAILKHVVFRWLDDEKRPFVSARPEKFGGAQSYKTYEEAEAAFALPESNPDRLMSGDLKKALIRELQAFLAPIRDVVLKNRDLYNRAYPELAAAAKKEVQPAKGGQKGGPKKAVAAELPIDPSRLNILVGRIVSCEPVEGSDKLYKEMIDLGEEAPRQIVSGLQKFIPLDKMQNRLVAVLCNLKEAKLAGVVSQGMVLCASTDEKVELISPPEGAKPGERLQFKDHVGEPDELINTKKKKNCWVALAPDLRVNSEGVACWKDSVMTAQSGACTAETLKDVPIK